MAVQRLSIHQLEVDGHPGPSGYYFSHPGCLQHMAQFNQQLPQYIISGSECMLLIKHSLSDKHRFLTFFFLLLLLFTRLYVLQIIF